MSVVFVSLLNLGSGVRLDSIQFCMFIQVILFNVLQNVQRRWNHEWIRRRGQIVRLKHSWYIPTKEASVAFYPAVWNKFPYPSSWRIRTLGSVLFRWNSMATEHYTKKQRVLIRPLGVNLRWIFSGETDKIGYRLILIHLGWLHNFWWLRKLYHVSFRCKTSLLLILPPIFAF